MLLNRIKALQLNYQVFCCCTFQRISPPLHSKYAHFFLISCFDQLNYFAKMARLFCWRIGIEARGNGAILRSVFERPLPQFKQIVKCAKVPSPEHTAFCRPMWCFWAFQLTHGRLCMMASRRCNCAFSARLFDDSKLNGRIKWMNLFPTILSFVPTLRWSNELPLLIGNVSLFLS